MLFINVLQATVVVTQELISDMNEKKCSVNLIDFSGMFSSLCITLFNNYNRIPD